MKSLIIILIGLLGFIFLTRTAKAPMDKEPIVNNTVNIETIVANYNKTEPLIQETIIAKNPLLIPKGNLRNDWYLEGECELAAKTWQKEYGGELVFIAPYDINSNKWILGDYAGAWINRKGNLFIDYFNQQIFLTKDEVIKSYKVDMRIKLNNENIDVKVFILGIDTMPYPIVYHY